MRANTMASLMERVSAEPNSGCWLWTGSLDSSGYASASLASASRGRRNHRLSRVLYKHLVGPIPNGLQLDHLCRVRSCVNPRHLEPVTTQENTRRGIRATATHCMHGHARTAENTRIEKRGHRTVRRCLTCVRARELRAVIGK